MNIPLTDYMGQKCFCTNLSYNCPALKLWGYSTESKLHAAIRRKLKGKWVLIDWDGNPALKLKCWRKSFGRGHVSVGVGDFMHIVYSHGANSDDSLSSTRARPDGKHQTEQEAMAEVDAKGGYYD